MQFPQTTYNEFPATAKNGMVSKNGPKKTESKWAKGFVTVGTFALMNLDSDDQCKAIPDATAAFTGLRLGAVTRDSSRSPYSAATTTSGAGGQYADGESVPLLTKGNLQMYSENAATAGHPVFVRCTAAGADVTGQIRDGAAANFVQHPTAVFAQTTSGAGPVNVEVK